MAWGESFSFTTRLAKPSHELWTPSPGQRQALQALVERELCALWADPGAGKTSIALAAFSTLQAADPQAKLLVVAPLRVCQLQWRQEAQKWTQFKHLKFAFLHGAKKGKLLHEDADIYLINYEGLDWLSKQRCPYFDIVCLDESTKIKNHTARRSKALRALTPKDARRWMLTGTPAPNGYIDLFGQFLWLDGGKALGKFISHFRDMYMKQGFNGFDWELQTGADERIEGRIAPLVFRLPYTDLPPLSNDVRWIELEPAARKLYKQMQDDLLLEFKEGEVTAVNAGALQSKLSQMANGALYLNDKGDFTHIHDQKLDALEELVEEMSGQQLLVAYEFRHDLARLQARFGADIPFLGGGVSAKRAEQIQDDWNAGKIKLLFAHPASVGHGLNLQRGGASHICWFGVTWDLELWEQFIRRLWRQGNQADRVVNHILAVKGTIDTLKLAALDDKTETQAQLLQGFISDLLGDTKETTMTQTARLGHQAGAQPAAGGWGPGPAAAPAQPAPQPAVNTGGWGPGPAAAAPAPQPAVNTGGWGPAPAAAPAPQPETIVTRITPGTAAPAPAVNTGGWGPGPAAPAQQPEPAPEQQPAGGLSHFSPAIQAAVAGEAPVEQAPAPAAERPKRSRKAAEDKAAAEPDVPAAEQVNPIQSANETNIHDTGAYINIRVSGNDPAKIRAALRALLG